MSKFFEVSDDFDLSLLGEHSYKFKEYQPEDVEGLKSNANKLLSEKKTLEAKAADLEAQIKKIKVEGSNSNSDPKSEAKLQDALSKIDELNSEIKARDDQMRQSKIKGEADKIAATLTKDTRRAALLAEKIESRIDLDNGNLVVMDINGNPTVSTLNDLTSSIKSDYDFLVDGSQASGGGSPGGRGGAASTKKFNEYTGQELAEIRRTDQAEYDRLKQEFQSQ